MAVRLAGVTPLVLLSVSQPQPAPSDAVKFTPLDGFMLPTEIISFGGALPPI